MSSDQQRRLWFRLLDSASGEPYKGASATKVAVSSSADVDQFRKAVKAEHSNKLSSFDAADLFVYKNKSAFDKRNLAENEGQEKPIDSTESLGPLLGGKDNMLVVAVPSSEFSLTGKQPHPERVKRWRELNKAFKGMANKKSKRDDDDSTTSIAFSEIIWDGVKDVFNITDYVQPQRVMDEDQLSFLAKYLLFTTKCFADVGTANEAQRLHFIAPILICVCCLLPDVKIVVEEKLIGSSVKAHGRFEFMLKRGNKAVCIVLAKKEDFEQGMVQALVGCEVAAEVGGLDVVYGIVTNYILWYFFCSRDATVEKELCYLTPPPTKEEEVKVQGPDPRRLKIIAQKIYGILSPEETKEKN